MPANAKAPAPAGDRTRLATRVGSDYVLRALQLLSGLMGGDLLSAIVWLAIIQANIAHIDRADRGQEFGDLDSVPPDEVRRPVSVLALSSGIGLPYETTRRYVAKLVAAGRCVRVKGGVIVPAAVLDSPAHRQALEGHMANLRRLFRELKAAGVPLD